MSSHVRFVMDEVALGYVSSEYYGFPCQFSFHQMLHTHLPSGAGTIGQLVTDMPSELFAIHNQNYQVKGNKMNRARSMQRGEEECM
jgi:hypothetical protein